MNKRQRKKREKRQATQDRGYTLCDTITIEKVLASTFPHVPQEGEVYLVSPRSSGFVVVDQELVTLAFDDSGALTIERLLP